MTDMKRWRGLKSLLQDAVEQGATAIEKVHLETARRPFTVIEKVAPPIEKPVQGVHAIHDAIVSSTYTSVRLVNRLVGKALDVAIDALDDDTSGQTSDPNEPGDKVSGQPPL
ncbi:MAG TPA: hypothetical protein VHM19_01975 [Polyangiales bacterium]|jgi:hypothetical protein|nr:hypothetical protein [Polyangiales bacterium]